MIVGIGVDIVQISRIEHAMRRRRFVERILHPTERQRATDPEWVAGRWAAKEAIAKSLGRPLRWHDVIIEVTESGAPKVLIRRPDLAVAALRLHVAISHDHGCAVAFAIAESAEAWPGAEC